MHFRIRLENPLGRHHAVHSRHRDIRDDDIRLKHHRCAHHSVTIRNQGNDVKLPLKHDAKVFRDRLVIFNQDQSRSLHVLLQCPTLAPWDRTGRSRQGPAAYAILPFRAANLRLARLRRKRK